VLLELQSQGKDGLVEPQELFQLCLLAGLVEVDQDVSEVRVILVSTFKCIIYVVQIPIVRQRHLLLTVALENHLVSLLKGCILHWKDGESF